MTKSITIVDPEYHLWLQSLSRQYRLSQLKAAVKVNSEMLQFYWALGRDIVKMHVEERWGEKVISTLAHDLKNLLPEATGLSRSNLYYIKKFYLLYSEIVQQPVGHDSTHHNSQQENLGQMLFSVPWGHHVVIMDKCQGDIPKAIFYLNKIVEEGWSRSVLLNMIDSQLHLRQGHAVTNFVSTLPDPQSDLARETLRDPYCFDFTQLREPYNERSLKDALIKNVEKFLLELGTGFAYMGREFRLEVGNTELFADMLFYNTTLHCYVVIEVKTTELTSSHIGQLGGYVVAVDRQLCRPGDNKTIGLLICKTQDRILAQYALESSSQPLAVSEYELERFYPQRIEGIIPSVEELERHLEEKTRHHD